MITTTPQETGYPATLQNFNSTALDFLYLDSTGEPLLTNFTDAPFVIDEIRIDPAPVKRITNPDVV